MNMLLLIQLDILDFIFKGILIGVIASAPMGPVGILCIQRTLNKGRWYGFITGVGAAISDIIYALTVGLGTGSNKSVYIADIGKYHSDAFRYLLFCFRPYKENAKRW